MHNVFLGFFLIQYSRCKHYANKRNQCQTKQPAVFPVIVTPTSQPPYIKRQHHLYQFIMDQQDRCRGNLWVQLHRRDAIKDMELALILLNRLNINGILLKEEWVSLIFSVCPIGIYCSVKIKCSVNAHEYGIIQFSLVRFESLFYRYIVQRSPEEALSHGRWLEKIESLVLDLEYPRIL